MTALTIRGLRKTYANGVHALKGIDLTVPKGSFFGLLGPNGAGKSTTIGIVSSLVRKTEGSVTIFDHNLDVDPRKGKQQLGLVPQEFNFNLFETVQDILINQAGYYGIPRYEADRRAKHFLKKLDMLDRANLPARFLSGGFKRRLMIARALIHHPKLLILDEPTAGIDIELRRSTWRFMEEINKEGTTIILTTHNLEEAELMCERIAIINHGNIIADRGVKQLLLDLDSETLVLDLKEPVSFIPHVEHFDIIKKDELTLEVSFPRHISLNALFAELTKSNCEVVSLRNKTNRLEELFLDLVGNGG